MSSDFHVEEGARSGNSLVQGPAWSGTPVPGSPPSVKSRNAFEPGAYAPGGGFVFVTNPPPADLRLIYEMALQEIGPGVAPLSVLEQVYARNRAALWTVWRSSDEHRLDGQLVGFCAFLPLNGAGLAALNDGTLKPCDPDLAHLAPEGEAPAALYLWAVVARGLWDFSGKLIAHAIGLDIYERIPMFGRIGTQEGLEALRRSSKCLPGRELQIGAPFEIRLTPPHIAAQRAMRVYEGRRPEGRRMSSRFKTLVAATPDHLAKVFAIRAAVYMTEQKCPYDEEYDGNDFTCTHILGLVEGEPAAVLRIRYFADFVKIERLAVLPRFRGSRVAFAVVEHALNLVRRKGYRTAYGHAQKKVEAFWSRFGFKPMEKNTSLVFSDHEYVEMVAALELHHDRITIHSDPYLIIRPEGRWDEAGVLDQSASRPATNPR